MTWPAATLLQLRIVPLLSVNPYRKDSTPGPFVPVGFALAGGDLYVRSMSATGKWFQRALRNGTGTIRVGLTTHDVIFHDATNGPHDAYAKKYRLAGRAQIETITHPDTYPLTLRIDPR